MEVKLAPDTQEALASTDLGFDPETGATTITLADGKARKMEFTSKALRILEEATGEAYAYTLIGGGSAKRIVALVYAGCFEDALKRRENWTLDAATNLVAPRKFVAVWKQASKSLALSITPPKGESPAAPSTE